MKYFYYFKIKNKFIERLFVLFIFLGAGAINTSIAKTASTDDISIEMAAQLSKSISIEVKQSSMRKILYEIQKQTKLNIIIEDNDIDNLPKIDFKVKDMTVGEVLSKLTYGTPYSYQVINNSIAIAKRPTTSTAQQNRKINITGKVVNAENNSEIVGATIIAEKSGAGAITDAKGNFALELISADVIEVSYIGYISQTINVNSSINNLVVKLVSDDMIVDDVVVTGYFNKQKETYTGAVSTFTGKELRSITTGNMLSALSMLDPSFTMVDNNEMGSDPNNIPDFEIRGSSSIKGDYDGSANMPTFILDGFEVTSTIVYDLDPHRIKSMTILKDASATAIYGSRAANGVVVIETIAPEPGKLRVSYNFSLDLSFADLSSYNLMNAAEKLEYELRAGLYESAYTSPSLGNIDSAMEEYNEKMKLIAQGYDTEWYKMPVKDVGVGQKHAVTAEGGSDEFRYAVDLYYSNTSGIIKESGRESFGGGVKLQYVVNKLKFTNYTTFDNVVAKTSPYGDYSDYTEINPYYYPYDSDGNLIQNLYSFMPVTDLGTINGYVDVGNPLWNAQLPYIDEEVRNTFRNTFSLEYDFMEGLKLKANLSLNLDNTQTDDYKSYLHTSFMSDDIPIDEKGSYYQCFEKEFTYDANVTLSYFKQINKHAVNAGFVYNIQESNSSSTALTAYGFPNINMDDIGMGVGFLDDTKPTSYYDISRLVGFALNTGYSYDNKYLFDFSLRSDASSIFGANNRWGTFWSIGLGWNLHKEEFLKDNEIINLLKVRGSVGTTGGQNFSSYQALNMFSYDDSYIDGVTYKGYMGALLIAYGNEDLKWQQTEKKNIGLDFELLDRRLTGTVNVYSDLTKDALIDVSMAPSLGFSTYKENLGKIRNSGYEISLKGTLLKDLRRNIRWDIYANIVQNKNVVVEINDALEQFNLSQDEAYEPDENHYDMGSNKPSIRYAEGLSQNTIWANESLGIDPSTGEEIFLDMNGEITNEWSAVNYKPLGCTDPKAYGTFGTMLTYKQFEFNASFYYRYGGQIYNQTLADKIENVNPNLNGDARILTDRWYEAGDNALYKGVSDISSTYPTSRFIEDNNYIKLQSISLAYNLNSETLQKLGIERLKISAISNDVFTISSVEMERGTSYPFARSFSMALQVIF